MKQESPSENLLPEQTNTEFSSLPPAFCGKPERRRQEK